MYNGVGLGDARQINVCQGLDTSFSLINHDCNPNSHYFVEGRQLCVRTLRAVHKGEELTVQYVACQSQQITLEGRRKKLQDNYGFSCSCK